MILKDFVIEEVGSGKMLRLRCRVVKKWEGKWREIKYFREWLLNAHQRQYYPDAYMQFIQMCYQELVKIDELHICITNEEQFTDGMGNPLFDKEIKWQ